MLHCVKVEAKEGVGLAVENIECGAWPRVDLEQTGLVAIDQEIGAAESLEAECRGNLLGALRQPRLQLCRKLRRLRRAAIAPFRVLGGRRPLLTEAEYAGAIAGTHEQSRYRASLDVLLEIDAACGLAPHRSVVRHHVAAASAALALGEPAVLRLPRVCDGPRMGHAEAGERRKKQLRVLYLLHHVRGIAEKRPALGDVGEQAGAILEACTIDDADGRRGRLFGKRFKRRTECLPLEAALQIVELVAGISDVARVGIGEEIHDEGYITCSSCRGGERASRHGNYQQRHVRRRASEQGRKRRGSRDKAASPTRSFGRTGLPLSDT